MSRFDRLKRRFNTLKWDLLKKKECLYVAFLSTGGVGDLLVHLNFLKAFRAHCEPSLRIDLYHSAKLISSLYDPKDGYLEGWFNRDDFGRFEDKYDLVFSFHSRYPKPTMIRTRRTSLLAPECFRLYKAYFAHYEANCDFYDLMPRLDGIAGDFAVAGGFTRLTQPDINRLLGLGPSFDIAIPVKKEKETLEAFGLEPGRYLTFNNSVDTGFSGDRSTKLWLPDYFEALFELLHQARPDLKLVFLGPDKTPVKSPFVLNLTGETNFEELKAVLKNAALHIGPEGGMVHMRQALGGTSKTSCVLFGPTSRAFFGYPDNINLEIPGVCLNHCEWLSRTWQESCVRVKKPLCDKMKALTPEIVFDAIKGALPC